MNLTYFRGIFQSLILYKGKILKQVHKKKLLENQISLVRIPCTTEHCGTHYPCGDQYPDK